MSATTTKPTAGQWSNAQAFTSTLLCLFLGIGGGYLIRRSHAPSVPAMTAATSPTYKTVPATTTVPPSPAQVNGTAEVQAAVKLEQLKSDPNNVALLTELGNIY